MPIHMGAFGKSVIESENQEYLIIQLGDFIEDFNNINVRNVNEYLARLDTIVNQVIFDVWNQHVSIQLEEVAEVDKVAHSVLFKALEKLEDKNSDPSASSYWFSKTLSRIYTVAEIKLKFWLEQTDSVLSKEMTQLFELLMDLCLQFKINFQIQEEV